MLSSAGRLLDYDERQARNNPEWIKTRKTFAPKSLSVLTDNLGYTVSDAIAQDNGIIRIELSNKVSLSVTPKTGTRRGTLNFDATGNPGPTSARWQRDI